eukprot:6207540-Pleurochrysis_carterae.AAC.1
MGTDGAVAVARAARAFRARTGLAAGIAARGEFAAQKLQAQEATSPAEWPRQRTPEDGARRGANSPPAGTSATSTALTTMLDESPRARIIRQLMAEKAAEAAAANAEGATQGAGQMRLTQRPEGRRLNFDDAGPSVEIPEPVPKSADAEPLEEAGASSASPRVRCARAAAEYEEQWKDMQASMEAIEARTRCN